MYILFDNDFGLSDGEVSEEAYCYRGKAGLTRGLGKASW